MQITAREATDLPPLAPLNFDSSILIIGAGTWGVSTALHLARRGYNNVTVLDAYAVPSPISAGNDINKILELSSSAPRGSAERVVSDQLAHDAVHGWRHDPVFKGYSVANGWQPVNTPGEFRKLMPEGVLTGDFPGWKGWYRPNNCGWVEARNALVSAAREATRFGVKFVSGPRGQILSLVYENGDVRGAVTAYGPPFLADRIILCVGANANELFDLRSQLRPSAWTLAHIRMNQDERALYKDLPVLFNIERGFFMEPDTENGELKICDEHPGYCNWETSPDGRLERSVPFAYHQIPKEAEHRVRMFLRETMPHLAERPFSFARICWCADTPDRAFLISEHPRYRRLVLGVGGSGHGFSYIPAIGGIIADCLERTMDEQMKERFRWRPETAEGRDWTAKQDRFGPPGSNHVMDFHDVKDWTNIEHT